MPIFMDRHDLPESVTAEEVARLHQEDLKIEHKFGCKGMTYWFDEVRNTAFCLVQAPNKQALQDMHNAAHGAVANQIIEVEPNIVESFLGRIEDPIKARNTDLNIINDPAFRVLMVVSQNSRLNFKYNNGLSDRQELTTIKHKEPQLSASSWGEASTCIVNDFNGTLVQSDGSRRLVSFRSVTEALNCARNLMDHLRRVKTARDKSKSSIENSVINIGLSSGLPFEHEKSLFKEAIEQADRLCSAVKGSIIITTDLRHLFESENQNIGLTHEDIRTLNPEEERFLNVLMDFLDNSYVRADLKVEHFSLNLGLSRAQLYRKVKGLTGRSLNTFLKDYRLDKALQLLLRKQGNISEVAFDTGFNSPAYFSKCFFQAYNILPSKLVK
jgi:AraC-like DNA-binding protein